METITMIPATPRAAIARTLKALKRHRDLSDAEIGARAGMKRSTVASKISGDTGCSDSDIFRLAYAFGVEPHVLYMPKAEAIRWVLDNPRPMGDPPDGDGAPVIDLRSFA
jgi:transcriptional regulator with XRE-family HTH domain